MKYSLIAVILFSAFSLFPDSETRSKLELFLKDSPEWRLEVMKGMAARMDIEERQSVYRQYKKDAVGPFFLNLLLPIGSAVQGDAVTFWSVLGIELTGATLLATGVICYIPSFDTMTLSPTMFSIMILSGIALVGGAAIYQWIAPWVYAGSFNNNLERALLLHDSPQTSANVVPAIAYIPGKDFSLGMAMRF